MQSQLCNTSIALSCTSNTIRLVGFDFFLAAAEASGASEASASPSLTEIPEGNFSFPCFKHPFLFLVDAEESSVVDTPSVGTSAGSVVSFGVGDAFEDSPEAPAGKPILLVDNYLL